MAVNSSLYGILISLRDGLNYSTSPGGLPNGCYNGHVFWDVEQFMWPNLLLLHPPLALGAMQYRYDRIGAAQKNSRMTNTSGLKFPWESGFTGLAATVLSCQQNEIREIHIDGDVSLAMYLLPGQRPSCKLGRRRRHPRSRSCDDAARPPSRSWASCRPRTSTRAMPRS